ncbi:hypothetical protein PN483_09665 [Nodularia spumigena CS-591/04]|nr:hypothetical protein [Nodularia spumigena]MDB9321435.1 hypothetical protein [Nodularia spumigena CS-591/07A]MDB9330752.1 hypothetical protein [Nodularia spumigena CS-591/04]
MVLSRDICKNLQDALETLAVYRFRQFFSKIIILVHTLGVYRYKNLSIH